MIWVKAFHVVFMVTWFAGLFYLPRLYVYHAVTTDEIGIERFKIMERRLFVMMTIGAIGTALFGLALLFGYAWQAYASSGWLHVKLTLVAFLIGYHIYLYLLLRNFAANRNRHTQRFYRWVNELPSLFLIGIVILAVVKPF